MKMSTIKERDIGIDILRIILAVMVIIIHINAPATGDVWSHVNSLPMKFLVYSAMALVYPAVNCYVIISGFYYYKNNRSFKELFPGLIKLWLCLLFYSTGGYIFSCLFGYQYFCIGRFVARLFPVTTGEWWFMTNYFVLILISPILNGILYRASKDVILKYLCVSLLICSVLPFFNKYDDAIGLLNGYGLIWFIVLYLTGGAISKFYQSSLIKRSAVNVRTELLVYLFLAFVPVFAGHIFTRVSFLNGYTLQRYNSPVVYFQAVILFLSFYSLKIWACDRAKNIISFLSGLSLASYILHCQQDLESIIWNFASPSKYANSFILIPLSVCIVLSVFFVAITIEFTRRKMISVCDIEKKLVCTIKSFIFENKFLKQNK